MRKAGRAPRPPRGGARRDRVPSPGNAPSLRHVRPRPRSWAARPLPTARLLPRLRAAGAAPPVPHHQPDLRQQGPRGARAADLLPRHVAQVFGSSGQDWHVQEQQPQHLAGEELLHGHRHLHHRLRAHGLPPQLQPQRALALQEPELGRHTTEPARLLPVGKPHGAEMNPANSQDECYWE